MTLCSDCRLLNDGSCTATGNMQPDYINGGARPIFTSAQSVRIDPTMCGPSARWFIAKADEPVSA